MHYQVAEDHGYTAIANVDIMDENGSITFDVEGGQSYGKLCGGDQDAFLESMAEDGKSLINRIESRNGRHTLEQAEKIGLDSREYQLVNIVV